MNLVLIKPKSSEWEYMWDWLEKHPLNKGLAEPSLALNEGEAWQYMGSYQLNDEVVHTFRHRNHPITNGLQNVSVRGSETFSEDQIEKKFRK